MSVRLPSPKTLALALIGLVVAYLLFGWLAVPPILQSQAERYIAAKTGHRLTLDRPEFNPLKLSLRLANLRLEQADGKPLLGFRELNVALSPASIVQRTLIFDSIRLDGPEATLALHRDGSLNWSPLLDALKSKEEKPPAPLPRLDIHSFVLAGGRIDFTDERVAFATRVEPLDLELSELSTRPDDQGHYKISARTSLGARLLWHGDITLNPLAATGAVGVEDIALARLAPYFKNALPVVPAAGVAGFSADYRLAYAAGKLDLKLDKAAAKLAGLRLQVGGGPSVAVDRVEVRNGHFDLGRNSLALGTLTLSGSQANLPRPDGGPLQLLQLGSLTLQDTQVKLAEHSVVLGQVALKDGRLRATRDARGQIDILAAMPQPATSAKPVPKSAATAWHYRVNKLDLTGFSADFRDEGVAPAANFALDDIAVAVEGISDNFQTPLPVRAAFRARSGGSFEAVGQIVPGAPTADLQVKLADLDLKPAQPYLAAVAKLQLASGWLGADGRATYGKPGTGFKGGFALRDLRLTETDTGDLFLAWKSCGSRDLEASLAQLNVGELDLAGLDTSFVVNKDKSVNVVRILRKRAAPTGGAAAAPAKKTPYAVSIDRLRIAGSEMDFADHSLSLPFGTRIHHLHGVVAGLSSRPGAPGQIELDGQVDDYGTARVAGQVNLFNPGDFTDLKVAFRNVEMTRLTPYSATFAGRKIDSGKLSLDLEYKFKKRRLEGENRIVMDQLTLGERVESPTAKDLPLDLAIAVLRDSAGRIELGLPVSGSLDDPQFSIGSIVWKAILNVVGKIATAPFRALGALFGGSGEKIANIDFEAGAARLAPPEREKLLRLADALVKRPGLVLTLHGVYADADRLALRDRQLRRTVAERAGQQVAPDKDPGPLSTRTPKVQAALESLYTERVGGDRLAALKDAFRKANPGQLEQGLGGRMLSRLSDLLGKKPALNEQEVAQLEGADFYGTLFERLLDRETVADAQLLALATARGENTAASLKAAGAPADRVVVAAPAQVAGEEQGIPLKLALGAASAAADAK